MRKLTMGLCTMALPFFVWAQQNPEKYAGTITVEDLQKHLTYIAGPETEGRETATEGQRKAATYIVNHFRQLGLKAPDAQGTYLQLFNLVTDTLQEAAFRAGKTDLEYGKDFASPTFFNRNAKIKAKKIVFAGYGIADEKYNDYEGLDVKGAYVVIAGGEPKNSDGTFLISGEKRGSRWTQMGSSEKIKEARKRGAVGVLVISMSENLSDQLVKGSRKSGDYFPSSDNSELFPLNISTLSHGGVRKIFGTAAENILSKFKGQQTYAAADRISLKQKARMEYHKETKVAATSSNVIGFLEGTDKKDEYVVLTAHYDHLGKRNGKVWYGADDDGSGTVAVMEMAEAFARAKAEGNGPRRSIIFMAVSGEEKGLWGSEFYADNPLYPLAKTTVNLNTDMIGRIDPSRNYGDSMNYVYVIGDDKLSSDLAPITDEVNRKYVNMELDRKYNDLNDPNRFYYRSDHYNFAKKGVPIIFYFNGVHRDYHQPTDTVDKINWDLYKKRIHLIFHTAWHMANMDRMLKRDMELK